MTAAPMGRPRAELEPATRHQLEERAGEVQRLEAELEQARADLLVVAWRARSEGASFRAIGEALGRHPSTVHGLLEAAS